MTTSELIAQLSKTQNISIAQSSKYLKGCLDIIKQALASGDEVKLEGFGRFVSKLHRRQVHGYTKKEISPVNIEVIWEQYPGCKQELVKLSNINHYIDKEVEYCWVEEQESEYETGIDRRQAQ